MVQFNKLIIFATSLIELRRKNDHIARRVWGSMTSFPGLSSLPTCLSLYFRAAAELAASRKCAKDANLSNSNIYFFQPIAFENVGTLSTHRPCSRFCSRVQDQYKDKWSPRIHLPFPAPCDHTKTFQLCSSAIEFFCVNRTSKLPAVSNLCFSHKKIVVIIIVAHEP